MIKVVRLNSGWDDPNFEDKLQALIDNYAKISTFKYRDIKITSNGNGSLVIFESEDPSL